MNNARKQIEVTSQVRQEIQAAFKCTRMALWRAVSYESDTDLSRRIRKLALAKGGVVLCVTPMAETIHDHAGFMRQYFLNGAMLEANKNTGLVLVLDKDGNEHRKVENCSVAQLEALQSYALQIGA
mgnify:FL=1